MRESDSPFRPSPRMLRQFAALWMLFFGGMATWHRFGSGNDILASLFLGMAVTIGPMGVAWPKLIRPIFVGWLCLAFPVGWVISHLILACLYYGVIAPVGLFFRLIGRDALALRRRSEHDTYWIAKPTPSDIGSYYRQS